MNPVIMAIASVVVSLAIYGVFAAWLRCYTADHRSASRLLDDFYTGAQELLTDKSTPASVVDFIQFLAERVGKPRLARSFALDWALGRIPAGPTTESGRRFQHDLDRLKGPQREAFTKMVASGMFASAAADPIFSRVYLMFLDLFLSSSGTANDTPSPERARTVALDVSSQVPCLAGA